MRKDAKTKNHASAIYLYKVVQNVGLIIDEQLYIYGKTHLGRKRNIELNVSLLRPLGVEIRLLERPCGVDKITLAKFIINRLQWYTCAV